MPKIGDTVKYMSYGSVYEGVILAITHCTCLLKVKTGPMAGRNRFTLKSAIVED